MNDPEAVDQARKELRKGLGIDKVAMQVGLSNSTVARLKAEMTAPATHLAALQGAARVDSLIQRDISAGEAALDEFLAATL